MTGWAERVEPVTATVACRGAQHRVRWEAGRLRIIDHDLDAELVLRGLGGASCTCLEVVDLWHSPIGPNEVYALWTATAEWPSAPAADHGLRTSLAQRLADDRQHALLASLPLALRRRLALEAMARLPAVGDPLQRIVASLAVAELAATLPVPSGAVDIRVCLHEGAAELRGEVAAWGGWVRLDVSPRWVPEIWACHRSRYANALVIDRRSGPDGCDELIVASWRQDDRAGASGAELRWRPRLARVSERFSRRSG